MGEGYGCSNFQCSTLATAIKFIHMQLQAGCHCVLFLHQLFVHQIKDDTNRQVTKDCTQLLACFTCEVNGFVQIPYMRAVHMLHAHRPIAF